MRPPSLCARQKLTRIVMEQTRKQRAKPRTKEKAGQKKRWNIVRGDKVQVIGRHPEAGKQGIVKEVIRKIDRVVVEGINLRQKKIKGNPDRGIKGRTIEKEGSIPYPAVSLIDPVENVPTRIVRKFLEDGTKVRVSVKSGSIIPKPEILKYRKRPMRSTVTESCTAEADAWEVTYIPPWEKHAQQQQQQSDAMEIDS